MSEGVPYDAGSILETYTEIKKHFATNCNLVDLMVERLYCQCDGGVPGLSYDHLHQIISAIFFSFFEDNDQETSLRLLVTQFPMNHNREMHERVSTMLMVASSSNEKQPPNDLSSPSSPVISDDNKETLENLIQRLQLQIWDASVDASNGKMAVISKGAGNAGNHRMNLFIVSLMVWVSLDSLLPLCFSESYTKDDQEAEHELSRQSISLHLHNKGLTHFKESPVFSMILKAVASPPQAVASLETNTSTASGGSSSSGIAADGRGSPGSSVSSLSSSWSTHHPEMPPAWDSSRGVYPPSSYPVIGTNFDPRGGGLPYHDHTGYFMAGASGMHPMHTRHYPMPPFYADSVGALYPERAPMSDDRAAVAQRQHADDHQCQDDGMRTTMFHHSSQPEDYGSYDEQHGLYTDGYHGGMASFGIPGDRRNHSQMHQQSQGYPPLFSTGGLKRGRNDSSNEWANDDPSDNRQRRVRGFFDETGRSVCGAPYEEHRGMAPFYPRDRIFPRDDSCDFRDPGPCRSGERRGDEEDPNDGVKP